MALIPSSNRKKQRETDTWTEYDAPMSTSNSESSLHRSPRLTAATSPAQDPPAVAPATSARDLPTAPQRKALASLLGSAPTGILDGHAEHVAGAAQRNSRLASRLKNPRFVMRQWLNKGVSNVPTQSVRSTSPSSDSSRTSQEGTVRTVDTMSENEDSVDDVPLRRRSEQQLQRWVQLLGDGDAQVDDLDDPAADGCEPESGVVDDDDQMDSKDLGSDAVGVESVEDEIGDDPMGSAGIRYMRDPARPKKSRKLNAHVDETILVPVPALKKVHKDWANLFQYLTRYQRRSHQAIRVQDSVNVVTRNAAIANTVSAKKGMHVVFIPMSWEVYKRTFICTHGWKPKSSKEVPAEKKEPSGGKKKIKRNMRFLRGTECPFRFVATVTLIDGEWVVLITASYMYHNHPIGPEVFKTYAENRGVEDVANMSTANAMMENERKPRAILNKLLESGENVTRKDVENMIYAYKTEVKKEDNDVACLALLAKFTAENEKNLATIDETNHNETGVISITSGFMSDMTVRFGEMVLIDCTHKTNRYNYQLLTVMGIDEYGEGTVLQHSLLERNADWHMSRALDHFTRAHPGCAEKVQVIMVDKDLNEIKVLRVYFPRARILICVLHVLKYLKHMIRKPEFVHCPPTTATPSKLSSTSSSMQNPRRYTRRTEWCFETCVARPGSTNSSTVL